MKWIRVAYNQKDGFNPNKIDYSHPRIIDETEKLNPLEVNDGELAKEYLKVFENMIIEAQKNHEEIQKELKVLPRYINQVLEITHNRVRSYERCYEDLTEYEEELLRLGYKVKEQEYTRNLNQQLNKIMKLLSDEDTEE